MSTRPEATAATANPEQESSAARTWVVLALAAAAMAYRELVWYVPDKSLAEELEQLLFIPSQGVAPLVVLLAAWLLYRRAPRLWSLPRGRSAPWLGGGCLATGAFAHLWATHTGAPDLLVPSLGLVGLGAAALWKGRAAVRVVLVPALFLLFAMPLPAPLLNAVVFRLQIATAELSGMLLAALRIPHHVAGEQILRTSQTFSVIEACSGLRSIETLAMVAILMADLFRRPAVHAFVLVLAAPPVALLLNGWRAVALILNPHSELAAVHNLQGVAILLGGLVLLFLLDGLLERVGIGRPADGDRRVTASAEAGSPGLRSPIGWRAAPAGVVLGALALASLALPRHVAGLPEPLMLSSSLAVGIGDLFSQELETDRVFLGSAGFRESVTRRFRREGHPVDVFVGLGWRPGRARSALSPKTARPGSGWILEAEQTKVLRSDGREVSRLLFRSETQRLLVYHWYEGSLGLAAETVRSLAAIDSSPLRRAEEILAVRMATDIDGPLASGLGPAEARLDAFYARLRTVLDRVASQGQLAWGKGFPDFPGREELFLDSGIGIWDRALLDQLVERMSSLGMALANQDSGNGMLQWSSPRQPGGRESGKTG